MSPPTHTHTHMQILLQEKIIITIFTKKSNKQDLDMYVCTRGSVVVDCTPSNAFPLPCLFPVAIITMEQKEKACQHSKVAKL